MIDRFADFAALVAGAALFLGFWALLIGGLVVFYRGRRSPVTRAVLVIVPLLLLDGLVAGQGLWSTLVFLVGFGAQTLLAAGACARRSGWLARRRLVAGLLYAGSILAIVAWVGGHNGPDRYRDDEIILARRGAFDRLVGPCTAWRATAGCKLTELLGKLRTSSADAPAGRIFTPRP